MLSVTFYRDSHDRLSSFFAYGHAGFAHHGEDIICAAVSGILQAARLGLEAHVHVPLDVAEMDPGNMRISWPASCRDDERLIAIVATAELSVEQIAKQYPEHVTFSRATDEQA
jgi:uncharacterized protein YsxB (DUF464 family)